MKEFFISCEESLEQIDPACCGVAVGSSSPGCAACSQGCWGSQIKRAR